MISAQVSGGQPKGRFTVFDPHMELLQTNQRLAILTSGNTIDALLLLPSQQASGFVLGKTLLSEMRHL